MTRPFRHTKPMLTLTLLAAGLAIPSALGPPTPAIAGAGTSSPAKAQSTTKETGQFPLMPGDQVRLSFLEQVNIPTGKKDANTPVLRSVFERTDLSGEFEVTGDGRISHPLLGLIQANGKQLHELEADLKKSFTAKTGSPISVRARYTIRPPVYVTGLVGRPGAYKYVQSMTVAQAVTLASGLYRPGDQRQVAQTASRENANITSFSRKLQRALARKARLQAELAGTSNMKLPPALIALTGKKQALILIANESRQLKRLQKMRAQRHASLAQATELAQAGISTLLDQKRNVRRQAKVIEKKLRSYKDKYKPAYFKASIAAIDALTRVDLVRLNIKNAQKKVETDLLQARQRKLKAEQDILDLRLTETRQLSKELDDVEIQIIDFETGLAASRQVVTQLGAITKHGKTNGSTGPDRHATYQITRRTAGRLQTITATDNTLVRPGDIVRLNMKLKK